MNKLFDKEKFEDKSKILFKFIHDTNNARLENQYECLCAVYDFVDKKNYPIGEYLLDETFLNLAF